MTRRSTCLLAASLLVAGTGSVTAFAATRTGSTAPAAWTAPTRLGHWAGGEPSVAFDPAGNGSVYIVAPQGIPTGVNLALGGPATKGIGFWASSDHGRTFPITSNVGSAVGGGDSDVDVAKDHTVFVSDLEAAGTSICRSTDSGKTFADASVVNAGCSSVATGQTGPDNDREWLNHAPNGDEYLTYHDFAANVPLIYRSTDHGTTFLPCGDILGSGPGMTNFVPAAGGDLVAKPVVDQRTGSVYVGVTEPDSSNVATTPVGTPLGNLYMAVASGGCTGTTSFTTHTVYANPGANLAKDFDAIAEDGAGNLYMVAVGTLTADQKANGVYVFTSHDHGTTWSKPQQVNAPNLTADAMPAITAGKSAGQVAVGWFGSSSSRTENDVKDQWRYYVATSINGGKSFRQSTVTKNIIHYGDICTQGIMCGLVPGSTGDRNLADFSSLAVDPATGNLLAVFPGDPENRPDLPKGKNNFSSSVFVASQLAGPRFN
ncbi:MAG: hypothetical protein NVS3B26_28520 [Mycobacteriales bacterium]